MRCEMCHEMLTQRALFCIDSNTRKGMLSQQFVMHVAPPLHWDPLLRHSVSAPVVHVCMCVRISLQGPLSGTVSVSSHPLSPTLEIAAASPSHEGWYQCKVTDGHVATHCGSGALPCVRTDALSDRVRVQVIGEF